MSNIYVSVRGRGSSDGKNLHETSAVSNNSNSSSEDSTTAVNCQHPIVKSFHLTQFMVFWIAPLFEIADKRQLLDTDVWSLPPSLSVHSTYDKFWRTWEGVRVEDSSKGEKTSLYRVLVRCYFKEFIYSGLLQLVFMLFQLGQPFLIIEIVKYVATGSGGIGLGIGLALALGCVSLCSSLSLATSLYLNRILGIEVKAGLMTAVYKQSLNLTSESRLSYSVGQITNLVAIDADKIFMAVQFPHFLWQGPITCIAAMGILMFYVGVVPALAGMITIALLIPIQNHLAARVGILRRSLVQFTDERVKLINEILQGIRMIKLYAWEVPTEDRIYKTRDKELRLISRYLDINGILRELLFATQPIITFVMFMVALYGMNNILSRIDVIRIIAFLNITRLPLNLLGVAMKSLKDGVVSSERLERFLQSSTVKNSMRTGISCCVEDPKVHLSNACFSWSVSDSDSFLSVAGQCCIPPIPVSDGDNVVPPSAASQDRCDDSAGSGDGNDEYDNALVDEAVGNDLTEEITSIEETAYEEGLDLDIRDIYYCNEDNHLDEQEQSNFASMQQESRMVGTEEDRIESDSSHSFKLDISSFRTRTSNELIAVIGSVGSGKSSFMAAILGEIPLVTNRDAPTATTFDQQATTTTVTVHGPISYCSQTAWIQNMTLKENVLFGISLDANPELQQSYQEVLRAAALVPDLKVLPFGDDTEIGERGINLSGGQKARVSLARAFLSACRSQIFLLDDPFSAVDGATGNWIFEHGIKKLLHDKIRIVALNSHLHLLRHFDRIVILDQGCIVADGTYAHLFEFHSDLFTKTIGKPLHEILSSSEASTEELELDSSTSITVSSATFPTMLEQSINTVSTSKGSSSDDVDDGKEGLEKEEEEESQRLHPVDQKSLDPSNSSTSSSSNKQLIEKEKAAKGEVSYAVYMHYLSASLQQHHHQSPHKKGGNSFYQESKHINFQSWYRFFYGIVILVVLSILFVVAQIARIAVDYYLIRWSVAGSSKDSRWGTIYFILLGILGVTLLLRSAFLNYFAVLSSRTIHASVLRTVLSASIPAFFDTHTVGEILNRFSKDCETMDVNVPEFMLQMLINWLQVLAVFALCIYTSPWFLIIMLPLAVTFRNIFVYFSKVSRDLKRLDSISRSPIFAMLSETLTGLETIRAYGDTSRFMTNYFIRMEYNHKFFFHLWMCLSWVTVRLEITSTFILLSISILTVCIREQVSPVALALALSYALQLTALFQRCVQLSIDVSTYMTSTERMLQYLEIPVEKSTINKMDHVIAVLNGDSDAKVCRSVGDSSVASKYDLLPTDEALLERWPRTGSIEFRNVWMNYRSNPSVLRGISFKVRYGERIGVCGRTGAGKSSLMVALFRIVELSQGVILIDDVDISQVPLQLLRSKLAIIPQDPVLLTGSIRFQLDPFETYSDLEVWSALEKVNMKDAVKAFPNGLSETIRENGENLSQGQRQLICIARALLRQAQVLVVDEGTSAVDPTTDELIQNVLRSEAMSRGTTVLAIAHRLQTIIDFDRILVLGAGTILEYDTPAKLMSDPESKFSQMLIESSL